VGCEQVAGVSSIRFEFSSEALHAARAAVADAGEKVAQLALDGGAAIRARDPREGKAEVARVDALLDAAHERGPRLLDSALGVAVGVAVVIDVAAVKLLGWGHPCKPENEEDEQTSGEKCRAGQWRARPRVAHRRILLPFTMRPEPIARQTPAAHPASNAGAATARIGRPRLPARAGGSPPWRTSSSS